MWINVPQQTKVIARYGADAQAMVHMEEAAELIQAGFDLAGFDINSIKLD